ncbi:MAG: LuxR C-terminal-related transcriptional regulator [Chloroflexota bacterium]
MTATVGGSDAHDPLHDWRVAGASPSLTVAHVDLGETPFVGREHLLSQFKEIFTRVRAGRGLVAAIVGEMGSGKSRTLFEIARLAAESGFDVAGAPPRSLDAPIWTLDRTRPLLMVCDDVDVSTPALDRDVAALAEHPVLVTFGLSEPRRLAREVEAMLALLGRCRLLHTLPLPPLGESELHALASGLLGATPDVRLQTTISHLSEGNPLLAETVVRDLVSRSLVSAVEGTAYLLGTIPPTYVPETAAAAINLELRDLPEHVLRVLACAAALGPGFRFDVLRDVLGESHAAVLDDVEAGLACNLLQEVDGPPDDLQFRHELVRRVLYSRLSATRRRQVHQRTAEVLEGDPAQPPSLARSDRLAFHFSRGTDRERALEYILRAQERAEHLCDWNEAVRYCREGLDLARQVHPDDDRLRVDLLDRLAALYFGREEIFAAGTCLREAHRLCDAAGRVARLAVLSARLAGLGRSWCPIEVAEAAVHFSAAPGADPDEPGTWLADAYISLGIANQRLGRLPRSIEQLRLALDATSPSDWTRHSLVEVSLASSLITAGLLDEAIAMLHRTLDRLERRLPEFPDESLRANYFRDPRRVWCLVTSELGRALTLVGAPDEGHRLAQVSREREKELGLLGGLAHGALALAELRAGRPAEALRAFTDRLRESTTGMLITHRTGDLALLAEIYLELGDADRAVATADEGLRISHRTGAHEHLAALEIAAARAHAVLGRRDRAAELATAALLTIDRTGTELFRGEAVAIRRSLEACPSSAARRAGASPRRLSQRERQVLLLVAEGHTNRQIARALVLSDKTIKRHLSNIMQKLGASTRAAAVARSFELRLL